MELVPREGIPAVWSVAREFLMKAITRSGRWSEADVLAALLTDQNCALWLHPTAAVVTRIVQFPQVRVCEMFLMGGSGLYELRQYEGTFISYARLAGCSKIEEIGRPGWEKVASSGWEKTAVRLTKEL